MEVDAGQPGGRECFDPRSAAEVAAAQQRAVRPGEDLPVLAWPGEAGQVPAQYRCDQIGERDRPRASVGLWGAECEAALLEFG